MNDRQPLPGKQEFLESWRRHDSGDVYVNTLPLSICGSASTLKGGADGSPIASHRGRMPGGLGDSSTTAMALSIDESSFATGIEQKICALSRRTAAELKRAEKERREHSGRLEALEELCRQQFGNLEERLGQASSEAVSEAERVSQRFRTRIERDLELVNDVLSKHKSDALVLQGLAKRFEADHETLEEMRVWRRKLEEQLELDAFKQLEERMQKSFDLERKQAHERLRSSCSELTAHLNQLRMELVEQRRAVEHHNDQRELLRADLESQMAELGGALAHRLQGKNIAITKAFEEALAELRREVEERTATFEASDDWLGSQLQVCRRENAELLGKLQSLHELIKREAEQAHEVARDEARTVHLEVMSVDTRLASLEERLAADPDRQRYLTSLRVQTKHQELEQEQQMQFQHQQHPPQMLPNAEPRPRPLQQHFLPQCKQQLQEQQQVSPKPTW